MRVDAMVTYGSAKKLLARLAACGSAALLALAVSAFADAGSAAAQVTAGPVTPALRARVGTIAYGMVTITNRGSGAEMLMSATAPNPPFWPTWGGTCNSVAVNKVVAPGRSCTFQFGFKPTQKGHVTGQGTITFQSGNTLTVQLTGVGR
jgi:hypothetical protein